MAQPRCADWTAARGYSRRRDQGGGYGVHLGATRQWCSVTSDGDDAKGGGRTGVAILGRRVRGGWDANDKDVKIGQYMVFAPLSRY